MFLSFIFPHHHQHHHRPAFLNANKPDWWVKAIIFDSKKGVNEDSEHIKPVMKACVLCHRFFFGCSNGKEDKWKDKETVKKKIGDLS